MQEIIIAKPAAPSKSKFDEFDMMGGNSSDEGDLMDFDSPPIKKPVTNSV